MAYDLFLFDADDTLFDFKACERHAFAATLGHCGFAGDLAALYATYVTESEALWREVEKGAITKEFLKAERFRRTFSHHMLELSAELAGTTYLDRLPDTCVLIEGAAELLAALKARGARVGIITNGFEIVQTRRLASSGLAPSIDFMVVSEQCGFAKPDVRFFEHTAGLNQGFDKTRTLVVGDRLETDVAGAHAFGVDACWFNPKGLPAPATLRPKYEIRRLAELLPLVATD